jgi:hypothetical protein
MSWPQSEISSLKILQEKKGYSNHGEPSSLTSENPVVKKKAILTIVSQDTKDRLQKTLNYLHCHLVEINNGIHGLSYNLPTLHKGNTQLERQ